MSMSAQVHPEAPWSLQGGDVGNLSPRAPAWAPSVQALARRLAGVDHRLPVSRQTKEEHVRVKVWRGRRGGGWGVGGGGGTDI